MNPNPYMWTKEQEAELTAAFRSGESIRRMAKRLNRSPNGIRRKLQRMNLFATTGRAAAFVADTVSASRGDQAFQQAMHAAINMGHESVTPGTFVDTSPPDHLIRPMRGEGDSGYRSSAGYTADMGETAGSWG